MNEQELRDFMVERGESPHVGRLELAGLTCYGCAHSSAIHGPPSQPSGERPCMSCVRNPERATSEEPETVHIGDDGHARAFDARAGTMYNGAPRLYQPMDNYVTLDQRDQEDWLDKHPEYAKSIRFTAAGNLEVVESDPS